MVIVVVVLIIKLVCLLLSSMKCGCLCMLHHLACTAKLSTNNIHYSEMRRYEAILERYIPYKDVKERLVNES